MAAGVKVTQGAETGAGREVARRWGEDQTSLSPKASEGEAGETEDSAGGGGTRAAVSPQPLPGDELGLLPALLSPWKAGAREGLEEAAGPFGIDGEDAEKRASRGFARSPPPPHPRHLL